MSERLKIALLRVLYSFGILTIGMVINSIFDYYEYDAAAYHVFTISWSFSLFAIIYSLSHIAKPITYIYRAYLMFLYLSFTNLCNALTFATTDIYVPSIWVAIGFVLYSIVLINEAIIKSKK